MNNIIEQDMLIEHFKEPLVKQEKQLRSSAIIIEVPNNVIIKAWYHTHFQKAIRSNNLSIHNGRDFI